MRNQDIENIQNIFSRLLIALQASKILKTWLRIKYPGHPIFQTLDLFAWVTSDNVLQKLEDQVKEFRVSERAKGFLDFINAKGKDLYINRKIEKNSSENSFIHDGAYWRINFKKKELGLIKSIDGMRYIAIILKNYPSSIDSQQLYSFNPTPQQDENAEDIIKTMKIKDESFLDNEGKLSGIARQHPGVVMLDQQSVEEQRKRMRDIEEKLAQIASSNYTGMASIEKAKDDLEEELDFIKEHLRKNIKPNRETGKVGLATFDSDTRKTSNKVHHALKTAYKNIQQESAELAEYLKSTIKSENNQFAYNPPKDNLISWEITLK